MKRSILLAFSAAFLSCEKVDETELLPDQPLYEVTFDLSDFTGQAVNPYKGEELVATAKRQFTAEAPRRGPAMGSCDYLVYNTNNELVKWESLAVFLGENKIRDSLPAGNYYIYFVGHGAGNGYPYDVNEDRTAAYYTGSRTHPDSIIHERLPELYFKSLEIDLREDTDLGKVTLERMTANIAVRLYDAYIPDSLQIWTNAITVNNFYLVDNDNPGERVGTHQKWIGRKFSRGGGPHGFGSYDQRIFDILVFPYRSPEKTLKSTVNIWATTRSGDTIASKTIEDIEVKRNKKIILKGYLLRGENSTIPPMPPGLDWPGEPGHGVNPPQGDLIHVTGSVKADSLYDEIERIEF